MDIGKRLRYIRQSKNISIYKLSEETGISQNHISGIELGKRQPTVDTLKRLVAPLGITLAELFNENENISILSNNERELVENYRILPNERIMYMVDEKFIRERIDKLRTIKKEQLELLIKVAKEMKS